jgi:hypothetical protein
MKALLTLLPTPQRSIDSADDLVPYQAQPNTYARFACLNSTPIPVFVVSYEMLKDITFEKKRSLENGYFDLEKIHARRNSHLGRKRIS